jgi:hypothetical protein
MKNLEPKIWDTSSALSSSLCVDRTEEMRTAYLNALAASVDTKFGQPYNLSRPKD